MRCTRLLAGVDSAGAACPGLAASGVLLDPVGASAGRADRVRPAVPLVRRAGHRRGGLGCHDVYQEPRPAARRRCRGEVPFGGAVADPGEAAVVERALLGGRHAHRSLGQPEELQAEGRLASRPGPAGTASGIFMASAGRTTPTPRARTRTRGSTARAAARKPSSRSWATRSWKTAMA